jgi:hypothetical protein
LSIESGKEGQKGEAVVVGRRKCEMRINSLARLEENIEGFEYGSMCLMGKERL